MKYNTIGVVCAMESEAEALRAVLENAVEERVGSFVFSRGKLGEKDVILAVCGIGKVAAAMCAQTLILHFAPEALINSGVAGSLTSDLEILDVALATELVQHDMDTSPLGDPVGMISGINRVFLPTSSDLRASLRQAAGDLGICAREGRIASGDQFIAEAGQKTRILRLFSPIACEMEGAAIAQVACLNGVPFACVRAISDSFDGKNAMDYAEFAQKAAQRGASLLIRALKGKE